MENDEQAQTPVYSFQKAKLCGAKTRKGTPCKAPAVKGKNRCRMHGGAKGSGAQIGNKNALKHGRYSKETKELRALQRQLIKDIQRTIGQAGSLF